MSGYGMPQGPTPGSPRSGRTGPALPVLELVGVGLAVLAFIVAFLPWAKPDVRGVDADSVNGWNLVLPTVATALLLVAAALVAAPLLTGPAATVDDTEADTTASPVPALLACLGALFMLVWVLTGGNYLGQDLSRGIGRRPVQLEPGPAAGLGPAQRRLPAAAGLWPAAGPAAGVRGPGAAARVRAAAVVRGARWLPRPVHRRAAGPAAVRAGAVPAAERWLPGPGRRLLAAGLGRAPRIFGGAGRRPGDDRPRWRSRPIQPRYRPTPAPCRPPAGRRPHPPSSPGHALTRPCSARLPWSAPAG